MHFPFHGMNGQIWRQPYCIITSIYIAPFENRYKALTQFIQQNTRNQEYTYYTKQNKNISNNIKLDVITIPLESNQNNKKSYFWNKWVFKSCLN